MGRVRQIAVRISRETRAQQFEPGIPASWCAIPLVFMTVQPLQSYTSQFYSASRYTIETSPLMVFTFGASHGIGQTNFKQKKIRHAVQSQLGLLLEHRRVDSFFERTG